MSEKRQYNKNGWLSVVVGVGACISDQNWVWISSIVCNEFLCRLFTNLICVEINLIIFVFQSFKLKMNHTVNVGFSNMFVVFYVWHCSFKAIPTIGIVHNDPFFASFIYIFYRHTQFSFIGITLLILVRLHSLQNFLQLWLIWSEWNGQVFTNYIYDLIQFLSWSKLSSNPLI